MNFEEKINSARAVWDECAEVYENQIVSGHPDITNLEAFEEDFLDTMLKFLIGRDRYPVTLMDIGCGSGRLHLRYLIKTAQQLNLTDEAGITLPSDFLKTANNLKYDPVIAKGLTEVWGIDFSSKMLEIAKAKLEIKSCIQDPLKLNFVEGSAYDLEPFDGDSIPISVSLINTIGIMQEPELLFKAMRRQVEKAGGIACIFCYKKESIGSHGLSSYESTLDVSGQPKWLIPCDYASKDYKLVAEQYKLAHSKNPELIVDVYDRGMNLIKKDFVLTRDPDLVDRTLHSGHVKTHSDYESFWYSFGQIDSWIDDYWKSGGSTCHLDAKKLDSIRAEAEQVAIYDPANRLEGFFETVFS